MANVKTWDFTFFTENVLPATLASEIKVESTKYAFQLEKCPTTGNRHFQGRVRMRKRMRLSQIKLAIDCLHGAHWSPTANCNTKEFNYALKKESRIEGPWTDKDNAASTFKPYDVVQLEEKGLDGWMQYVVNTCHAQKDNKTRDMRSIHVLVDEEGRCWKTAFARWMRFHGYARPVPPYRRFQDLIAHVMAHESDAYIFDLPRDFVEDENKKKRPMGDFFQAIEQIKNGELVEWRYNAQEVVRERPLIWIFTNKMLPTSSLSADRWKFHTIDTIDGDIIHMGEELLEWEDDYAY